MRINEEGLQILNMLIFNMGLLAKELFLLRIHLSSLFLKVLKYLILIIYINIVNKVIKIQIY